VSAVDYTELYPLICIEGAVDRFCGRPRDRNPYCRETVPIEFASWDFGWIEGGCFLDERGREEAARWLTEAA
jgi:hypothetical protein